MGQCNADCIVSTIDPVKFRQGEFWEEKGEGSIDSNIDKAFAALRRFVNDEINEMVYAVRLAEVLLKSGISNKPSL